MLSYTCDKSQDCIVYKKLLMISTDFSIKECETYANSSVKKYKKIAENDTLMRLIYDYFLDDVQGGHTREEAEKVIADELKRF